MTWSIIARQLLQPVKRVHFTLMRRKLNHIFSFLLIWKWGESGSMTMKWNLCILSDKQNIISRFCIKTVNQEEKEELIQSTQSKYIELWIIKCIMNWSGVIYSFAFMNSFSVSQFFQSLWLFPMWTLPETKTEKFVEAATGAECSSMGNPECR